MHKQVSKAKQAGKQPPREEVEQLSQASDASYLQSQVLYQHDINQKGNKL